MFSLLNTDLGDLHSLPDRASTQRRQVRSKAATEHCVQGCWWVLKDTNLREGR